MLKLSLLFPCPWAELAIDYLLARGILTAAAGTGTVGKPTTIGQNASRFAKRASPVAQRY